ncbi:MAG: spore maturation protein [Negativicutes bacterium]|nr:spore maturation protein [Negativicutes bacterium]
MINAIWLALMAGGIIYAAINNKIDVVTQAAISGAESAVLLSFKLIGVMCLWLGIMKIAEKAGVIRLVARALGPLIRLLFPSVPPGHPAMGSIIMTVSANMMGLGNAATPLGIKAMQELQKLNKNADSASEAMCTLLALCTTGFTLVPATIIALRSAAGSINPSEIVGATILVSLTATCVALAADWVCRTLLYPRQRR